MRTHAPAPAPPLAGRPPAPARPGHRLRAPLASAAAAAALLGYLAAVSPEQPGHYPVCPLYWATGLYCPGCGALRAAHALLHGDLTTAVHRNVLVLLGAPLVLLLWLDWVGRAARGRPARRLHLPAGALALAPVLLVLLVLFGVLRNTPWGAFLAP